MKIGAISIIILTQRIAAAIQADLTFNITPNQISLDVTEYLNKRAALSDSLSLIKEPSLENMILPVIDFENKYWAQESLLRFYLQLSQDEEVRQASREATALMNNYTKGHILERVFKSYLPLVQNIEEHNTTDPEYTRYLDDIVTEYARNTLDTSPDEKAEIKKLESELSDLCNTFTENIRKRRDYVVFSTQELVGLPSHILEQYNITGTNVSNEVQLGRYYTDILPVLQYAKSEATRKKAYLACVNMVPENVAVLKEIVKVRFRLAQASGYSSCSEFMLGSQMAKSKENVKKFLGGLKRQVYPLAKTETARMLAFKNKILQQEGLPPQVEYYMWDNVYYTNLMSQSIYNVDQELVSEYFPLLQTLENILSFCESTFDLKFAKMETSYPHTIWHEDVIKYTVYQKSQTVNHTLAVVGYIYFDLHPRQGKVLSSASIQILPSFIRSDGSHSPGSVAIMCNFEKHLKSASSLLKHHQVVELLHEVGHGLHIVLSETKTVRLSSFNVPKDFLECPSQVMEYWAWSKSDLKTFSSHYLTGDPIPDILAKNVISSAEVNNALHLYQQIILSYFDMALHDIESEEEAESLDIIYVWNSLFKEDGLMTSDGTDNIGFTTFDHLAMGYHTAYYGYLYADVFAADIFFSLFKDQASIRTNGVLFKNSVLKHGSSKDTLEMLRELLGREPRPDTFLEERLSPTEKGHLL